MTRQQWIADQVVNVQSLFIDNPALRLTVPQTARCCGLDEPVADAIVALLVDAGVLVRMGTGEYHRFVPGARVLPHRRGSRATVEGAGRAA